MNNEEKQLEAVKDLGSKFKEDIKFVLQDKTSLLTAVMIIGLLITAFLGGYYLADSKCVGKCNEFIVANYQQIPSEVINNGKGTIGYLNFTIDEN